MQNHHPRLFHGLALVARTRDGGSSLLHSTADVDAALLPILRRLALPSGGGSSNSHVRFCLGATQCVSYKVLTSTPWLGEEADVDDEGADEASLTSAFADVALASSSAAATAAAAVATLLRRQQELLQAFAVVIIADRQHPSPPLRHACRMLGEALLLQEQLGGFMSGQVARLLRPSDFVLSQATDHVPGSLGAWNLDLLLDNLANDLQRAGRAHVELPRAGGAPLSLSLLAGVSSSLEDKPLRPYHALLLLGEPSAILSRLPADASPQLAAVLERALPTRSIGELQAECGLPASQVLRLAGHLVHHGLAAIVDAVSEESRFSLREGSLRLPRSVGDAADFARCLTAATGMPPQLCDLTGFLCHLSRAGAEGLTLRAIMGAVATAPGAPPPPRAAFVHALTWLLRRRFVRQVHSYVLLLWPWASRAAETLRDRRLQEQNGEQDDAALQSTDLPWAADETACAARLATGKPEDMQLLFRRLLVYLRGVCVAEALRADSGDAGVGDEAAAAAAAVATRHEELMWRLRVSRGDLNAVLTAFPEVFVQTMF